MSFEINLIFMIKPFFQRDQKLKKLKFLENENSF